MPFRVACAQFAPLKAEVEPNLDVIAEIVLQSQEEEVDLLLFPETSTTGYFMEGGVIEASLTTSQLLSKLWKRLEGKIHRSIDIVVGFYENSEGTLYNSAAYIEFSPDGVRLVGTYQKFFLPTYGVFDEERFVTRGRHIGMFESRLGKVGVLICEDVWHGVLPTLLAVRGAQLILILAASPARGFSGPTIDNQDRYHRLFRAVSEEHSVYCACAQLVGFEGGKGFIGGSMVVDPTGEVTVQAPAAEPSLVVADVDFDLVTITRAQSPLLSDLMSAWEDVRRLVAQTELA